MSDKPSGDNKFHQIVLVLITTIAAPIIVFMVTNSIKDNTGIATTVPPALTATLPSQPSPTHPPAQVSDATATARPIPTSALAEPTLPGISNPSGSIPAGIPALVDGLVLLVNPEDVTSDGQYIHITLHIKNNSTDSRTLVFTPGAVSLQDDARHHYEPYLGDKKSSCKKTDLDVSRNVAINPQSEITLSSVAASAPNDWCAQGSTNLPLFTGPIETGARKLLVIINEVGPFQGFQIEIVL